MKLLHRFLLLCSALALAVGCGGGSGTDSGASSMAQVYVTDAPGDYSQAWVTVKQVDVVGHAGSKTVYRDATGQTIDLVALNHAGQPQFALLGVADTPAGSDLQVNITVDQNVTLVPTGSTVGTTYALAGSAGGTKMLTYTASRSGSQAIVVDFVLSEWQLQGGQIVAVARPGDPSRIGQGNHVDQTFGGTVSSLSGTAPNLAFVLANEHMNVHVVVNADTLISNEDGSENPVLRDGEAVHVSGTFDPHSNTITATAVVIQPAHHQEEASADGVVGTIGTDTFSLILHEVEGFHPTSSSLNVLTTDSTMFTVRGVTVHAADFYTALAHGAVVAVHGTYDSGTNAFTASHASILSGDDGHHHDVAVQGAVSAIDVHAGTFDVTVQTWEGTELTAGTVLHVVTNDHTHFEDLIIAHLSAGDSVRVVGTLDGSTMTASSVSRSHHG
jgi:hypothetical protein